MCLPTRIYLSKEERGTEIEKASIHGKKGRICARHRIRLVGDQAIPRATRPSIEDGLVSHGRVVSLYSPYFGDL